MTVVRTASAGVATTVELVALQVIPPTVETDLHDVPRELFVRGLELGELLGSRDAPTVGLAKCVAVDVRDEAQAGTAAHRAVTVLDVADVPTRPEQLGMGVADIGPIASARAEVAQDCPSGERVVDVTSHAAECRATTGPLPTHAVAPPPAGRPT